MISRTTAFHRKFRPWISGLSACILLLGLVTLMGCAEDTPAESATASPAVTTTSADRDQHIKDLEVQLESLAQQSEAMRREVTSRLDQIDVTREALAVQLSNLKGEVPPVTPPAETAPADEPAPGPAGETSSAETTPLEDLTEGNNPFLRFILLVIIIAAVLFLGRIFFERWGDPEDGDRPPPVETTTDLGKIRFPPGTEVHDDDLEDEPGDPGEDDAGRPGD